MKRVLLIILLSLFTTTAFAQSKVTNNLLVGISDATWGNNDAPVTILIYSDLQCPFCKKGAQTIDKVANRYGNDVRFVFRHFPLAFHKEAEPAARAVIAAQRQGKFKEMHDLIYQNIKQLKLNANNIETYLTTQAVMLGLDETKFLIDYRSRTASLKVKSDIKSGTALGVRGTPQFFVNGVRISGAQPINKFESVIDAQLSAAKSLKGMTSQQKYKKMIVTNYQKPQPRPQNNPIPNPKEKKTEVEYISIDEGDPIWGSDKALVTIIEFSEFQCPFCARVQPRLKKLKKKYGKKLRIVYKQNPLPFHKEAPQAAQAFLAASSQGNFSKMKDLLYEKQRDLKQAKDIDALMMSLAKKARLNLGKFKKAYHSKKIEDHIAMNMDQAQKAGARGTPTFFVNGVKLVGAKPYEAFVSVVEQQLATAEKIKKREKLSGNKLYRAIVNENEKNNPPKPKPVPSINSESMKALKKLKGPFWKGKKRAKVVVHMISDFQCPYCKRAAKTMDTIYDEYKKEVKFVFVNYYLPFHKDARIAHLAAIAAGRQGKFWEMHDKIFNANQREISQDLLDGFAKEIGLKMKRYHRDRVSKKTKKQLDREMEIAKEAGVRGTPNFNINGEKLVGAQPPEKFREILDRHLKKKK